MFHNATSSVMFHIIRQPGTALAALDWHAPTTEVRSMCVMRQLVASVLLAHEAQQHIEVGNAMGPEVSNVAASVYVAHGSGCVTHLGERCRR
jgi:hypothetical protein